MPEEYGSAFLTVPIDGIVGLGFQELVNVRGKALMETLGEETPGGRRIQIRIEIETKRWRWRYDIGI